MILVMPIFIIYYIRRKLIHSLNKKPVGAAHATASLSASGDHHDCTWCLHSDLIILTTFQYY